MTHLKLILAAALLAAGLPLAAQPPGGDIPPHFTIPTGAYDYERREVMIPMRDGVRLHTVIVLPRGAHDLPILLTRTPYNASARASRSGSPDHRARSRSSAGPCPAR